MNRPPVTIVDNTTDFEFQVVDWYPVDFEEELVDDDDKEIEHLSYVIKTFGVTENGNSVSVNIRNYQPYFFIGLENINRSYTRMDIYNIKIHLISILPKSLKKYLVDVKIISKKILYGFTNNEYDQYLRVICGNYSTMRCIHYKIQNPITYNHQSIEPNKIKLFGKTFKIKLYESNIEPFLRFIHSKNIKPSGWIKLSSYKYELANCTLSSKCQINIDVDWKDVEFLDINKMAPITIASFDIECTSSHGDFPVAQKDYTKTSMQILELFNIVNADQQLLTVKQIIKNALLNIFNISNVLESKYSHVVSNVYPKQDIDEKMIQLNILKNIDDIVHLLQNKISYKYGTSGQSKSNSEKEDEEDEIHKFKNKFNNNNTTDESNSLSKEQIIQKITEIFNSIFPSLHGDQCIQIGTTVHRYGEQECCYKNVITLDTCSDISDVDVIRCKTEKKLLTEWCKLINKIDPDVITGYNILGFDFEYMVKRSEELNCREKLLSCGRLKTKTAEYKEKQLSSSALGDNFLKYIDMQGRVIIDMMKNVQRDFKLDSYKLDNVASHFIQGKIKSIVNTDEILLDSIHGLSSGNYITFGNKQKRKIKSIHREDNRVTFEEVGVDDKFDIDKTMTWGMAKDDISPNDIFKCQKGTADDRAMIALIHTLFTYSKLNMNEICE